MYGERPKGLRLEDFGEKLEIILSQCYDDASVMSGCTRGGRIIGAS